MNKSTLLSLTTASLACLVLGGCQPDTPTARQSQAESQAASAQARQDMEQAGRNLGEAARSGAQAVGEGAESASVQIGEEAGEASVAIERASREAAADAEAFARQTGQAIDEATEPVQDAYQEGRQRQMQEDDRDPR